MKLFLVALLAVGALAQQQQHIQQTFSSTECQNGECKTITGGTPDCPNCDLQGVRAGVRVGGLQTQPIEELKIFPDGRPALDLGARGSGTSGGFSFGERRSFSRGGGGGAGGGFQVTGQVGQGTGDGVGEGGQFSFQQSRSSQTTGGGVGGGFQVTGQVGQGTGDGVGEGGRFSFQQSRSSQTIGGGVGSGDIQGGAGQGQSSSFRFSERRTGSASGGIDGGFDGGVGGAGQQTFSFRGGRTATSGTGGGADLQTFSTGGLGGTSGFETRRVQTVSTGTDGFGFQPRRTGGAAVQFAQNVRLQGGGGRVDTSPVVTGVPEYFTTTRYGPISSGGLRGEGDRSSSLTYTRQGSATGSLFSRDQAEASETASKTRGYEYRYREGHNYEQPRTLYNYDIEEPIWGFADVDNIYRGE